MYLEKKHITNIFYKHNTFQNRNELNVNLLSLKIFFSKFFHTFLTLTNKHCANTKQERKSCHK